MIFTIALPIFNYLVSYILDIVNALVLLTQNLVDLIQDFSYSLNNIWIFINPYIGWVIDILLIPKSIILGTLSFGVFVFSMHITINFVKLWLRLIKEIWQLLPLL